MHLVRLASRSVAARSTAAPAARSATATAAATTTTAATAASASPVFVARRLMAAAASGRMRGKVAVVTGAASGIGRGIAERYSAEGAHVVVADLNLAAAEAVVASLPTKGLAVKMDVSSEQEVEAGVAKTVDTFKRLDVMVCNAGFQHVQAVHELSLEMWRKMMSVHLDGAFLCTRSSLRQMYKQPEGGNMIYIGSVHSKEASVLKAPYVAAKHALLGLSRTVAKEGGPKSVSSIVICPGFVRTPLVEKQIPEQAASLGISEERVIKEVMLKNTVDAKFTSIDQCAEAAVFAVVQGLALTGQSMVVSHGWHMS